MELEKMVASAPQDDIDKLSSKINATCSFAISENCLNQFLITKKSYKHNFTINDGKIMCRNCSKKIKQSGRNNPNSKYTDIDDNFFNIIDSKEKAYLLGWIASDGHIAKYRFIIDLIKSDHETLINLKNIISKNSKIFYSRNSIKFIIYSSKISLRLRELLNLNNNDSFKKSNIVCMPNIDNNFIMFYIRGYFEGDGTIIIENGRYPRAKIMSNSISMLRDIKKIFDNMLNCSITKFYSKKYSKWQYTLSFNGNNAIKFLDCIYSDISDQKLILKRKYDKYIFLKNNFIKNDPKNKIKGEQVATSILTAKKVTDIRKKYSKGLTIKSIAAKYKVSYKTIYDVVKNITWKHVI